MNVYDSERMYELMKPHGYRISENYEDSDLIILNTCHIREKAAEKIYSELGKIKEIKKNNINVKLIITGCVAQAEGKAMISRQPIIDAVIGPQMYHKFNKVIEDVKYKRVLELDFDSQDKFKYLKKQFSNNKRTFKKCFAYFKISKSCNFNFLQNNQH